jgi:hypothetical protein
MLGTSKQVTWAIDIRRQKLEQIETNFQELGWFNFEELSTIQKFLNAQEDAGWWIYNRDVSFFNLILWAASYAGLKLFDRKIVTNYFNIIYPFPLLHDPIPEEMRWNIELTFSLKSWNSWIAVIDNRTSIMAESEICKLIVVEQDNTQDSSIPSFYISPHKPEKVDSKNTRFLYRLLQQQDGGWSQRGWQFLTICRYPNGNFKIEGMSGELITNFSFFASTDLAFNLEI